MKTKITFFLLILASGVFGTKSKDTLYVDFVATPQVYTFSSEEITEETKAKHENPQKEIKQFIKSHKKELKDTLKAIKKNYSKEERKALFEQVLTDKHEAIKEDPDPKKEKSEVDKKKVKLLVMLGVFIPLGVLGTVLTVFLIGEILGIIIEHTLICLFSASC